MLVYFSVMFLCCIIMYVMRNNKNKVKPLAISFGLIWLMIALQDGWGGDLESYRLIFEQLNGSPFQDAFSEDVYGEVGFKILMWFMPSIHAALMLSIGVWCFAVAFFFYHFVPQKWWFFAIIFVFIDRPILMGMTASILRMSLANSFLIFAVFFMLKKERIRAALLILLGAFFHTSVLFFLPLIFVGHSQNKIKTPVLMGIFAAIAIVSMLFPSSWTDLVESLIRGADSLNKYEVYLEDQSALEFKGLSLIILFYWVYLLADISNRKNLEGYEYLMIYFALIRIAFDLLPAVGMSVRFFYYIDLYFFAGMACVLNRSPRNDAHKMGLILTLIIMFYYIGFHQFLSTSFYREHWATYNLYF